jgi:hypothetical protein
MHVLTVQIEGTAETALRKSTLERGKKNKKLHAISMYQVTDLASRVHRPAALPYFWRIIAPPPFWSSSPCQIVAPPLQRRDRQRNDTRACIHGRLDKAGDGRRKFT